MNFEHFFIHLEVNVYAHNVDKISQDGEITF